MPLLKVDDISHFLQESSPVIDYFKKKLTETNFLVVGRKAEEQLYREALEILKMLRQRPASIVLDEETENGKGLEELLDRITDKANLPHIFHKSKYLVSGENVMKVYANGELEIHMGLEPS